MAKDFGALPPSLEERRRKIQQRATSEASPEAAKRKENSEELLCSLGVPTSKLLPVIETESEAKRRTPEEIAYRALALLVVAVKGEGIEQEFVEKISKYYDLQSHFSPMEKAFVENVSPTPQECVNFSWRYEALWTLLWALGYIEEMGKPEALCDVPKAVGITKRRTAAQFIADARLRPLSEILDQADLIYRYHWATEEARVRNLPPVDGIDVGVVTERHYTLNWLIGHLDEEWDDISTDT